MQDLNKTPLWGGDRYLPNIVGDTAKAAGDSLRSAYRRAAEVKFPRLSFPSTAHEKKGLSDTDSGVFVDADGTIWTVNSTSGLYGKGKSALTLAQATQCGFKASTWVNICVRKWMGWIGSVPMIIQREKKPGVWEYAPEHPYNEIFAHPNDYISGQNFKETYTSHKWLAGNALIVKSTDALGKLMGFKILRPDYVEIVLDDKNRLKGYDYTIRSGGKTQQKKVKFYPREDVIHLMFIDPDNPNWGCAPLLAGAKIVDSDVAAVDYNKSALDNQGGPAGLLALDLDMDTKDFKLAKGFAKSQIDGAANAKRTLVLGSKANYTPFSMSPEEMAYLGGRKWTAIEICALLEVQPPMAGIYDVANYKVDLARKIQWLDGIVPQLNDNADSFNFVLSAELGEGYRVWYDTSNVQALLLILDELMIIAKKMADAGYTMDIINRRLGLNLPSIPGVTNVARVPIGLQDVGGDNDFPFDDDDDEPPETDTDE